MQSRPESVRTVHLSLIFLTVLCNLLKSTSYPIYPDEQEDQENSRVQFKGVHTGWVLGSPHCAPRAPDIHSIHILAADPSVHQVLRQAQAKTSYF